MGEAISSKGTSAGERLISGGKVRLREFTSPRARRILKNCHGAFKRAICVTDAFPLPGMTSFPFLCPLSSILCPLSLWLMLVAGNRESMVWNVIVQEAAQDTRLNQKLQEMQGNLEIKEKMLDYVRYHFSFYYALLQTTSH